MPFQKRSSSESRPGSPVHWISDWPLHSTVTAAAMTRVVEATGVDIEWEIAEAGADLIDKYGTPLPDSTYTVTRILLGLNVFQPPDARLSHGPDPP